MKKILLVYNLMLATLTLNAQEMIAQFVTWRAIKGSESKFEQGYRQHLQWHKINNEPWDWYGWYIISGPRTGQFIDATFNHPWNDFDQAIKPQEDLADNRANVFPYGDLMESYKIAIRPEYSTYSETKFNTRLVRVVSLDANNLIYADMVLRKLKAELEKLKISVFKVVDGSTLNRYYLFHLCNSNRELGESSNLFEIISKIQTDLKVVAFSEAKSETLLFRSDMSLINEK